MFIVAIALSTLVGLTLGLLGGGGSILTVPILRYVLGVPAHEAIALSLLVVGTTSAFAVIPHARAGRVQLRTGLVFGAAGMAGAFAAGQIAHLIAPSVLLTAFAVMMFLTAFAMLRPRRVPAAACTTTSVPLEQLSPAPEHKPLPVAKVLAEGALVGAITGLVGAGGGFLVVPALVLLGGLPMELAVGTSLVVIAMKSLAGFAGFLGHTHVDFSLGLLITGSAVGGSFLGSLLVSRISPAMLRTAFGWFVIAMAFFILAQEVPGLLGLPRSLPMALLASAVGTGSLLLARAIVRFLRAPRSLAANAQPTALENLKHSEAP